MKVLKKWLENEARRERRRGSLDEALVTNRLWKYARYRLRYVVIRAILRATFHLIEIWVFASALEILAPVLVLRSAMAFGVSGWWGSLEHLRGKVRDHAAKRRWPSVRHSIDGFLALSLLLALVLLGGGATFVLTTPDAHLGFSIFDAFALGCLVRFALDLVVKAYHSGMFAIRRIHRPLLSLLVGDILDVLGVIVLYQFIGPWSFGIVIASVGLVRAAVAWFFVRRAYGTSKIPVIRFRKLPGAFRRIRGNDYLGMIKHGLANASLGFDAVLIIALVGVGVRGGETMWLGVMFYVIRPFIMAGHSWARLFYFDYKKLEMQYAAFFSARFERFMWRLSLGFSGITILLSATWIGAFWRGPLDLSMLLFVPFLVIRSQVGLYQIQAFSYQRYKYLAFLTTALGIAITGIFALPADSAFVLSTVSGIMLLSILILRSPKRLATKGRNPPTHLIPIYSWLRELGENSSPIRISVITARRGKQVPIGRVFRAVAEALEEGRATRLGRQKMLIYEKKTTPGKKIVETSDISRDRRTTKERIAIASTGLVESIQVTDWHPGGKQALMAAAETGWLGARVLRVLTDPTFEGWNGAKLEAEFNRRFKNGQVLSQTKGALNLPLERFGSQEPKHIVQEIRRLADRGSTARRTKFDVSAYCPGQLTRVFVLNRDPINQTKHLEWADLVRNLSFRNAIVGQSSNIATSSTV